MVHWNKALPSRTVDQSAADPYPWLGQLLVPTLVWMACSLDEMLIHFHRKGSHPFGARTGLGSVHEDALCARLNVVHDHTNSAASP